MCVCVCVQVVSFYISQSQAANHAVREAACACIAELGTKVNTMYVYVYIVLHVCMIFSDPLCTMFTCIHVHVHVCVEQKCVLALTP